MATEQLTEGARVRVTDAYGDESVVGDTGTIVQVNNSPLLSFPYRVDLDSGKSGFVFTADELEALPFEVGDRVRFTAAPPYLSATDFVGYEGVVRSVGGESIFVNVLTGPSVGNTPFTYADRLELIEDEDKGQEAQAHTLFVDSLALAIIEAAEQSEHLQGVVAARYVARAAIEHLEALSD